MKSSAGNVGGTSGGLTTVEAAEILPDGRAPEIHRTALDRSGNGEPVWVKPDPDFIRRLSRQSGDAFRKCFQCGTCSATCTISPDLEPFPRKEMAWARWGMKDRLLRDPDVWLCYQCHDCSTRCPRGARPGDVLAAVRQESITHHSVPRFLGRWLNQPQMIAILLAIPLILLTLALFLRDPVATALGITRNAGDEIVFSYSSMFPHWLLNAFFGFFSFLVLIIVIVGIMRFWRGMKTTLPPDRSRIPIKGIVPSVLSALKSVFAHNDFSSCTKAKPRFFSHLCVFFGFLALTVVSIWVITARYNPLVTGSFIYPFGFWEPWKMLANLGGIALVGGCLLMIRERVKKDDRVGTGSYFDWSLIALLLLVAGTGFVTEVLHYLRLEPHRHLAYFVHLMFAFAVIVYLPYSKLAHLIYRTTALVFSERFGRKLGAATGPADESRKSENEKEEYAEKSTV